MKKIFLCSIFILQLAACTKETEFTTVKSTTVENTAENKVEVKTENFVIRKRDSSFPLKLELQYTPEEESRSKILYKYEYLGQGFSPVRLPLFDISNITLPVLDLKKIIQEAEHNQEMDLIHSRDIHSWISDIATYTDFNTYAQSVHVSKTIKGGFSISNIPIIGALFGAGSKKTFTEIFNAASVRQENSVYGQLNIIYRDSLHLIQTEGAANIDLTNYYHPRFKKELYHKPMSNILKTYGHFLISSIETGGTLTALYHGNYKSKKNYRNREQEMYDSIGASMTLKESKGDTNISLHKGKGNFSFSSNNFSAIHVSFRTFGGEGLFNNFTSPSKIENLQELNFNEWAKSLKNKESLAISQIGEGGLIPFYDFFIEQNFQEQARKYTQGEIAVENKKLSEPSLFLETYGSNDMRFASLFLVTKYGDYIRLANAVLPGISVTHEHAQSVFNQMIDTGKNFFSGLSVKAKHYYLYVPSIFDDRNITEVIQNLPHRNFEFNAILSQTDTSGYQYCTCLENDNIYMISKKNKIVFTIAYDDIWTQYGLTKPANLSELEKISLHNLIGYTFFAL